MLSDEEIAKLCYGRIVKVPVYKSSGKDAAGPHWAVILDSDEEIREGHDTYFVAVISHNVAIDSTFLVAVPPRTGLTGFVICSWVVMIQLPGIDEIGPKLEPPEMVQIQATIRRWRAGRRPSTHS